MFNDNRTSVKSPVYAYRKTIFQGFGCVSLILGVAGVIFLFFFTPRFVKTIVQRPIYETKWKAEDWFDDPEVLKLCHAIERQDIETMERLIQSGVDVNVRGKDNIPLLLWAYPAGEEVLECLLKNESNPNFIIESDYSAISTFALGNTLLYMAVESEIGGDPKFKNYVDILLKYGADPDLGSIPPLVAASKSGIHTFNSFVSLVNSGADLNICDKSGNGYPVLSAATPDNFDKLFILLESGATYDVTTVPGNTLQRMLYKRKNKSSIVLNPDQQRNFDKVIHWLEDRGVSFDKPASERVDPQKLDPVRVPKSSQ
jgi:hypothetical protein